MGLISNINSSLFTIPKSNVNNCLLLCSFVCKHMFIYCLGEINKLKWAAQDLKGEAQRVQADFKLFEETLEDTNQSMDQVQLQLSQFASSLETCERTVSQSRVYQHATSGTITVIERVLTDIQEILADAELSIDKATVFAEGKIDLLNLFMVSRTTFSN